MVLCLRELRSPYASCGVARQFGHFQPVDSTSREGPPDPSLDTNRSAKKGKRTDGDFGLVWIQLFGQGRAFYSAFGHDKGIFWEPTILRHYLAGIHFACGDLAADATPKPQ